MSPPAVSSSAVVAEGSADQAIDDNHCCAEVISMLKETLNYHKGDHHTFFVFGASVSH